jgi:hypothetical protein
LEKACACDVQRGSRFTQDRSRPCPTFNFISIKQAVSLKLSHIQYTVTWINRIITFNFTSTTVPPRAVLTTQAHENHLLVKESGFDNDIGNPIGIYTQHMRFLPAIKAESTYRRSRRDGGPPSIRSPSLRHVWEYEWTRHGLQHLRRSHGYDPSRGGRLTVAHCPLRKQQCAVRDASQAS